MKVKTLSALAGIGAAMILSGTAEAAFTGLTITQSTQVIGAGDTGAGAFAGQTVTVFQIYANFSNANDELTAVFGDGADPLSILGTSPFFNNIFNASNSAPNPALFVVSPSLQYDSYLTIGVQPGGSPDVTQFSPGFPITGGNMTNIVGANNMAWFDPPGGQGAGTSVMLAQLTVAQGNHISGTINIQYRPAGAPSDLQVRGLTFNTIPAPGALALLGLAGLVGSRRRRG